MTTIMYVHGYGSNGNATKGNLLREMFPDCRVVSPTLDYNSKLPNELLEQLRQEVEDNKVDMIVGSSFGGYYSLCCATFFEGPIWLINPVHHVEETLKRIVFGQQTAERYKIPQELVQQTQVILEQYQEFDKAVFCKLPQREGQLHFALSTDDELLGDHSDLMEMFPKHGRVVWKEDCGHRFMRFSEIREALAETL